MINGYHYYATKKQVEESDIYIIDPKGFRELTANMPDTQFLIVYLSADQTDRKLWASSRSREPKLEAAIFDKRSASEDADFSKFEEDLFRHLAGKQMCFPENVKNVIYFRNLFRPEQMKQLADEVFLYYQTNRWMTAGIAESDYLG